MKGKNHYTDQSIFDKLGKYTRGIVFGTFVTFLAVGSAVCIKKAEKAHANSTLRILAQEECNTAQKPLQSLETIPAEQEYLANLTKEQRERLFESLIFVSPTKPKALEDRILPQVDSWVSRNIDALLTDKFKPMLKKSLEEATRYRDYIAQASYPSELDDKLIASVISTESEGKLRKTSKAGARGPMQLMPETARELGLVISKYVDERYGPKSVIEASKYLAEQIEKYGLVFGIAAYNGGPNRVKKLMKKYGENNTFSHLPSQTKAYVIKVISRYKILDNPEIYGIKIEEKPLYSAQLKNSINHNVKKGQSLYRIAKQYKVPLKEIKKINPQIPSYDMVDKGQIIKIPLER